jgi:F1F0 ATPase subunit 2
MIDWLALFWAWLAGAGIGLFYFGGLWLTVNQLAKTDRPGMLFLVSFLVRTAVSLAGFYLVMDSQWQRAAALLAGFLLARLLTVRYWGIAPPGR